MIVNAPHTNAAIGGPRPRDQTRARSAFCSSED
jgi:hypothetical protein